MKTDKAVPGEPEEKKSGEPEQNVTYLLRCSDGTLYCGWTNRIRRRLRAHNAGTASRYTRARLPVTLVYTEAHETRAEAMRREYRIKHMSREEKERLIREADAPDQPM